MNYPARKVVILFFLLAMTAAVFSQDKQAETLAVKNLVYECGPSMPKATLLTRSLVKAEGKLAKFDADSLYIRRDRKYFRTLYRDVLEIECRDKSVSNVPDPLTRPFGEWKEINQVYAATKIAVVLTDGTIVKGRSNTATDSHLVIFDPQTNTRRDIPREQVAVLFALIGGHAGPRSGAARASEGMLNVGGDAIMTVAAAGIGAIVGALMKSDGRPILVYSR